MQFDAHNFNTEATSVNCIMCVMVYMRTGHPDRVPPFSGMVDNVGSLLHLNHEAAGVGFDAV